MIESDEIIVLESMYNEEVKISNEDIIIHLEHIKMRISLISYPKSQPTITYLNHSYAENDIINISNIMNSVYDSEKQSIVLFMENVLEHVKHLNPQDTNSNEHTTKPSLIQEQQNHVEPNTFILNGCPTIYHSIEPLINKKSVFIAHAAKLESISQVQLIMNCLLSDKKINKATHNITAYRFQDSEGICRQECDDDGETAAGGRLMHMLHSANITNVFIMVSRWYGGVQLGPQRFKDINNVARSLLVEHGFLQDTHKRKISN